MLSSLHIENIAVIKHTDIDLESGFQVLTGETGAGKSILIDCINLLLGAKPSKDLIRSGESRATVSGLFTDASVPLSRLSDDVDIQPDEDGCILLTRSFDTDGKSQTKLNGRTIPVSLQKVVMPYLINIHGQNDNIMLMSASSHLEYLDSYATVGELLTEYRDAYQKLESCKKKILSLKRDEREKERLTELLKYQVADIDAAKLKPGEEEELEERKEKVKNAEKIQRQSSLITRALYRAEKNLPAYELIKKSVSALQSIRDYVPNADEYIEKLTDMTYTLEDIGLSVSDILDNSASDPDAELDEIEARLDLISKLKRKYGSDISEILSFRDKAARDLEEIESADELLDELRVELSKSKKRAFELAALLTERRRTAAQTLEESVVKELSYLEMPKVSFKVEIKADCDEEGKNRLNKNGADVVEFLLSANPGEPLKPLSKIASGGELSRIMLALKNINSYGTEGQTLIFDEIDTGVSGKTSQKIGIRLRRLARNNQVICVTHSAQIAAEAHRHYLISKKENDGRVETDVIPLNREGRINELARIMGGMNITDKLLQSAAEMLDTAGNE